MDNAENKANLPPQGSDSSGTKEEKEKKRERLIIDYGVEDIHLQRRYLLEGNDVVLAEVKYAKIPEEDLQGQTPVISRKGFLLYRAKYGEESFLVRARTVRMGHEGDKEVSKEEAKSLQLILVGLLVEEPVVVNRETKCKFDWGPWEIRAEMSRHSSSSSPSPSPDGMFRPLTLSGANTEEIPDGVNVGEGTDRAIEGTEDRTITDDNKEDNLERFTPKDEGSKEKDKEQVPGTDLQEDGLPAQSSGVGKRTLPVIKKDDQDNGSAAPSQHSMAISSDTEEKDSDNEQSNKIRQRKRKEGKDPSDGLDTGREEEKREKKRRKKKTRSISSGKGGTEDEGEGKDSGKESEEEMDVNRPRRMGLRSGKILGDDDEIPPLGLSRDEEDVEKEWTKKIQERKFYRTVRKIEEGTPKPKVVRKAEEDIPSSRTAANQVAEIREDSLRKMPSLKIAAYGKECIAEMEDGRRRCKTLKGTISLMMKERLTWIQGTIDLLAARTISNEDPGYLKEKYKEQSAQIKSLSKEVRGLKRMVEDLQENLDKNK